MSEEAQNSESIHLIIAVIRVFVADDGEYAASNPRLSRALSRHRGEGLQAQVPEPIRSDHGVRRHGHPHRRRL